MWVTAELDLPTGVRSPDTSGGTGTLGMCRLPSATAYLGFFVLVLLGSNSSRDLAK